MDIQNLSLEHLEALVKAMIESLDEISLLNILPQSIAEFRAESLRNAETESVETQSLLSPTIIFFAVVSFLRPK